jgi:hypothetical protein
LNRALPNRNCGRRRADTGWTPGGSRPVFSRLDCGITAHLAGRPPVAACRPPAAYVRLEKGGWRCGAMAGRHETKNGKQAANNRLAPGSRNSHRCATFRPPAHVAGRLAKVDHRRKMASQSKAPAAAGAGRAQGRVRSVLFVDAVNMLALVGFEGLDGDAHTLAEKTGYPTPGRVILPSGQRFHFASPSCSALFAVMTIHQSEVLERQDAPGRILRWRRIAKNE